jgi:hypothetical protein
MKKIEVEFVSPKELFKRKYSGESNREQRSSPLRYAAPVEAY